MRYSESLGSMKGHFDPKDSEYLILGLDSTTHTLEPLCLLGADFERVSSGLVRAAGGRDDAEFTLGLGREFEAGVEVVAAVVVFGELRTLGVLETKVRVERGAGHVNDVRLAGLELNLVDVTATVLPGG